MSRKARPEMEPCGGVKVLSGVVYTPVEKLKEGNTFKIRSNFVRVSSSDNTGVAVNVQVMADDVVFVSAFHRDDLRKWFPKGVPVHTQLKVITGEMEMTALNVPLGLTVGVGSGLLREVLAGEGALPGERYRVTFEQLPGVDKMTKEKQDDE